MELLVSLILFAGIVWLMGDGNVIHYIWVLLVMLSIGLNIVGAFMFLGGLVNRDGNWLFMSLLSIFSAFAIVYLVKFPIAAKVVLFVCPLLFGVFLFILFAYISPMLTRIEEGVSNFFKKLLALS